MMSKSVYPASPSISDYSFLNPSKEFRKQGYSVVRGILSFILTYFLMIVFGIGLLIGGSALAIWLLTYFKNLYTFAAALGLFAVGIMVFFFLIKFLFSTTKDEASLEIQIKKKDHPELYKFIHQVAREVKTHSPRKIVLTPEVNAAVFYNSSFWSMFLPVRKNLRIGVGLVNTLTVSEFKAVLAHEFGHFSQRSTKLGSYVYTTNKVIFNLVNTRDYWDSVLQEWSNIGGVFGAFADLTSGFVEIFRSILADSYTRINLLYMALSREMEYHADLVACSVAGNQAMLDALRKLGPSSFAYQLSLDFINAQASEERKIANAYVLHRMIQTRHAEQHSTDGEEVNRLEPRLNIDDLWASHPTFLQRKTNMERVNLNGELNNDSAWILFNNPEKVQEAMTAELYEGFQSSNQQWATLRDEELSTAVSNQFKRLSLPAEFNGFYDNRFVSDFNLEEAKNAKVDFKFSDLFPENGREAFQRDLLNQSDYNRLENLKKTTNRKVTFKFDDELKKIIDIPDILLILKQDMDQFRKQLVERDRNAFQFFYQRAVEHGKADELIEAYRQLFYWQKKETLLVEPINTMHLQLYMLQTKKEWTGHQRDHLCRTVSEVEMAFKKFVSELPFEAIKDRLDESAKLEEHISNPSLVYNYANKFDRQGFERLFQELYKVANAVTEKRLQYLKEMTELQSQLTR